jgi:Na+/H+ antiporter NhaD/arsenite permease-like protein
MAIVFFVGYLAIIFEHKISINKSAAALITAVLCWVLISAWYFPNVDLALVPLNEHLADISQILIFLLGAMTIVELINVYDGFRFITNFIVTKDKRTLLWGISFITFFVSALLDNMTTSIIMVLLLRRFIDDKKERFIFASMIIVAANAGGAWSPIGDVTTTMLWIDNRVSSVKLISTLILPSIISAIIPLLILSRSVNKEKISIPALSENKTSEPGAKRVLIMGVGALIFVPILRDLTGLPPYMGIILGLGIMWMLTDLIHQERHYLKVPHVLTKIDISSVLFFLGILLVVSALETIGLLGQLAQWMDVHLKNKDAILAGMGVLSSIIDNVPLTAAVMGMYDLNVYPLDAKIWEMSAYCLGTGGSLLIIGSAAGVVVMGMENIKFSTYFQKVTLPVLIGYVCGLAFFLWVH